MDLLREFELQQIKTIDRPRLRAGDIVRVEMKIKEAGKTRLQAFEGTVLGIRGSGPSVTFTVRRETGRFGVERIFPLYNPLITNIEVVKRQKVRRAKLTYLREVGRRRVKEDERAMQRLVKEEADKKRLAEAAKKKEEEEEIKKLRNTQPSHEASTSAKASADKSAGAEGIENDDATQEDKAKEPTVEADNEQKPDTDAEPKTEEPTVEAHDDQKSDIKEDTKTE